MAMAMRLELISPGLSFFATSQDYNTVFSIHGSLMLFAVAVVAIVGGFGNYFVPLMIGAEDMVFPMLNGVSCWFVRSDDNTSELLSLMRISTAVFFLKNKKTV